VRVCVHVCRAYAQAACVCTFAVHTLRLESGRQRGLSLAARHQGEVVRGRNQAIFHVDDVAVRPVVGYGRTHSIVTQDAANVVQDIIGLIQDAHGLIQDICGLIQDKQGSIQDRCGLIQDAYVSCQDQQGLIQDSYGLIQDTCGLIQDIQGLI
jgi:hypothetical protein